MSKKIGKIIIKVIGVILLLIGIFYLFLPHSIHIALKLDFGWEHYVHIALGGLLLVLGSILTLNGKRLLKGMYIRGWKKYPITTTILYFITFALLFLFFNSGYELYAGDVNNLKIISYRIASIGLSIAIFIGLITSAKIFGLKSTRY